MVPFRAFRASNDLSIIEDEFHSVDDILHSPKRAAETSEEDCDEEIEDEMDEILGKIKQRDEKYWLDAAEQLEKASASTVTEGIKRKSKSDREEQGKKKTKRGKGAASTATKKLENLLDQMPQFLATANQTAEMHLKALSKWEKKFGLDSSSDSE